MSLFSNAYFKIAAGDFISKGLIVFINLLLINQLVTEEYASFTLLLNGIFLGFQLACGPIERLYIGQYNIFKENIQSLFNLLLFFSFFAIILWLREKISKTETIAIFLGMYILGKYQVDRIKLQQKNLFAQYSLAEILKNITWLTLVIFLLLLNTDKPGLFAIFSLIAGTFFSLILLKILLKKELKQSQSSTELKHVFEIFYKSKSVVLYSLIGSLMPYLPLIMITHFESNPVISTYGAALRYLAILGMIISVANTVLLPQIASTASGMEREILGKKIMSKIPLISIFFILSTLLIWVLIPFIDNKRYPLLPNTFLILASTQFFSLITTFVINFLLVDGKVNAILISMALGLITNIVFYLAISSSYSSLYTSAWASFAGYFVICLITSWVYLTSKKLASQKK